MSVVTPRTQSQGLPANGVTSGAVQVTGTALRISARITSGNGPSSLALLRMNTGSGNWFRVTDINGQSKEWTLPGVGDSNQGNADLDITLPSEGSAEYYHLLVESPSAFPGVAEIESLSAPAAAGGAAPLGRAISTGGGITGGGDLSADRTLTLGGTADATLSTGSIAWTGASSKTVSLVSSGGAITITAGAASTIKTSSGAQTVDSAAALNLGTGDSTSQSIGKSGTIATFNGKTARGASAALIADPGASGAIPVTADGVCALTTAGAETRTLAIPSYVGQQLTLTLDTDGGDAVVTVASAINQTGNNTITLNDAGDTIHLVGSTVGGIRRWCTVSNDGCTLSTV